MFWSCHLLFNLTAAFRETVGVAFQECQLLNDIILIIIDHISYIEATYFIGNFSHVFLEILFILDLNTVVEA